MQSVLTVLQTQNEDSFLRLLGITSDHICVPPRQDAAGNDQTIPQPLLDGEVAPQASDGTVLYRPNWDKPTNDAVNRDFKRAVAKMSMVNILSYPTDEILTHEAVRTFDISRYIP